MSLIRSGKQARTAVVHPNEIDWTEVSSLQIWSMKHLSSERFDAPPGLDIQWVKAIGIRYAVAVLFRDGSWVWTDLTRDPDMAIVIIHRLSAKHDKPVQRGAQADELLRARGY